METVKRKPQKKRDRGSGKLPRKKPLSEMVSALFSRQQKPEGNQKGMLMVVQRYTIRKVEEMGDAKGPHSP